MSVTYIRRCPSCEQENAPQVMRCACGALLTGVDLSEPRPPANTMSSAESTKLSAVMQDDEMAMQAKAKANANAPLVCVYEDCAQSNPADSVTCLYCNRPLAKAFANTFAAPLSTESPVLIQSLLSLPSKLKHAYRILRPLPTQGAEAELLLVEAHEDGVQRIAKIYRHGIEVKADVQERLLQISAEHRVVIFESGISDGYAFELMEFCALGSLRQFLQRGALDIATITTIVRELSEAIASVHTAGLLHRDLKPENILLRSQEPMDLVLTDFGISSVLDATQKLTGTARTLPYAAPESLSGVIDTKADYWALGMMVLEASAGEHPFTGLSEAVILHHLTTREIEVTAVGDSYLRKLVRGLLLRDPQVRWGADEIVRWLARDKSLPDPVETTKLGGFREPYHIGTDICHSQEQLAVALARHWNDGVDDIANGQLLAWFRDVQKDQNAGRLLIALRYEKQLSVDVQLLKFILHLAPGIPPVWRGESIELPVILTYANQALKGDTEATAWLHSLYHHRILDTYADAGNAQAAGIVEKWQLACTQFLQAWANAQDFLKANAPKKMPGEYLNVDKLLYGLEENSAPALSKMHAQILAMAYDEKWSERLRQRLLLSYAGFSAYCPWLSDLGEIQTMGTPSLLVMEALLPEANKAVERQQKALVFQKSEEAQACREMRQELSTLFATIRSTNIFDFVLGLENDDLRTALARYFELLAILRASASVEIAWLDLKKTALRHERNALNVVSLLDTVAERRLQNTGWLGREVLVGFALATIILPILLRRNTFIILFSAFIALLAWRLVPNFLALREVKKLLGEFVL